MQKSLIVPILAIALALLCGCSSDELMGGDLMPLSDKSSIHLVDTITINAYTVREDTVYSANSSYLIAGHLDDPLFGKSDASFAAKFSNTSYQVFEEASQVDSIILTLGLDPKNRRFYGDSLAEVSLSVYALKSRLPHDSVRVYQDFDIKPLISAEPLAVEQVKLSKCDTLVRVNLGSDYARKVVRCCLDSTFDEQCCGLYFKIEASNSMVRFARSSDYTEYTIYHHQEGDTASSEVSFSIASSNPSVSMYSHDYSGAEFSSQLDNPCSMQDSLLYLQALCGTRIRLEFPYIGKFSSIGSKYSIITRARLILPLADSARSCEGTFSTIDNIMGIGCRLESGADFYMSDLYTVSYDSYGSASGFLITQYAQNYASRCYSIDFTGAMKTMLSDCGSSSSPDYGVYIMPSGRIVDFARSVINSPTHNGNPMRLEVEYMTFEK